MRRHREGDFESELNKGALWAVTYGDLMSYLMIFFLIMFAFSIGKKGPGHEAKKVDESMASIQKVFGGKVDPKRQKRMEQREQEAQMAERLAEDIKTKNLGELMEVKANEERVQLVLKDKVLFDSGKAELKEDAQSTLAVIVEQLKGLPNEIVVEGHTDNVPIKSGKYGSNYELSMARAYSVVDLLLKAGVDGRRLSGAGFGEHRPIDDNSTPEGRARNRRIEIDLIRAQ